MTAGKLLTALFKRTGFILARTMMPGWKLFLAKPYAANRLNWVKGSPVELNYRPVFRVESGKYSFKMEKL